MEVDAPGTDLAGQSAALPGADRRAASLLASTEYTGGTSLSQRLTAVARLVQIGSARGGPDGFTAGLIEDAETLLARAGERLRLSAHHTIAVLAGGTGSGKSSLFNVLAGAQFSEVGVLRPVTRETHACVWGMEGAGPLLDWLGIKARYRYARSSALDEGERALTGLLLVDLPDHDSVLSGDSAEVRRLVAQADLMVWVLDPQKYADAAVHSRYLMPMAGHSSVIAVALNQADLLTPEQADDCVSDLRRLLDAEGLHDVRVVVTSATTGAGVPDLRKVLMDTVIARQAAMQRIGADVDALALRFMSYAGEAGGAALREPASDLDGQAEPSLPVATTDALAEAFSRAAGVSGVAKTLESARELKAVDYVGWPVAWLADRILRRDPVRKARLRTLWDELRGASAGSIGAQQAEIDNALTTVADTDLPPLPKPWSGTVRAAVRSRAADVPAAIGAEIGAALPAETAVERWWRAIGVVQGLLLGCVLVGIAWFVALLVLGVGGVASGMPRLFSDPWLLPASVVVVAGGLLGGWLTARSCTRAVSAAAERETQVLLDDMRQRMNGVATDLVLVPAERELDELARFRAELRTATGDFLLR